MSGGGNGSNMLRRMNDWYARWQLRAADELGDNPWVRGQPLVKNFGRLKIGSDFKLGSSPGQSHIVVEKRGQAVFGDRVTISFGAAIHCRLELHVGNDCQIGPFAVIHDSDFHVAGQREAHDEPAPIRISDRVKLGSRVTVMRGTIIGEGACVLGGSVVSGNIEAGSVVGGVPARPLGSGLESNGKSDLVELVTRVLGLQAPPALDDGPDQIPSWDSLGTLKLLLALEEAYSVSIQHEAMKNATSVAGLSAIVERATQAREASSVAHGAS